MTLAGVGILLAVLTASPGDAVSVSMWAMNAGVEGRGEKKHFDQELTPIRDTVASLPFDTFTTVKVVQVKASPDAETRIPINDRYTLYLMLLEKTEDGLLRLSIRVEKMPDRSSREKGRPVNAFATRVEVKTGQKIKFKGLKNEGKELVIVLQAA